MTDLHIDIAVSQVAKKEKNPCGDYYVYEKNERCTTIIFADGMGSGVKAHISAVFCVTRLLGLIQQGYSLRHAFAEVVKTMHEVRGTDNPYAVFTVLRIMPGGEATVLSYEMPAPVFIGKNKHASVLPQRTTTLGREIIGEVNCYLEAGESLVIVSDGITQSGMGTEHMPKGWEVDGVCAFINSRLKNGGDSRNLTEDILHESKQLSGRVFEDDASVIIAQARKGKTITVLTGPPAKKDNDEIVVKRFLQFSGTKIICGGTTAEMAARILRKKIRVEECPKSLIAPPFYFLDGIQLVTEGAVTLNQAYHILDANPDEYELDSGVTLLCHYFYEADTIRFIIGKAKNVAYKDISFQQRGILPRTSIIPLLAQKLREQGKIIILEEW